MPFRPFEGVIGATCEGSKEDRPKLPTPPEGAPNVVVILLDEVGHGQTRTCAGPVSTPERDQRAADGLRCTRFQTIAIRGPSRARAEGGRRDRAEAYGRRLLRDLRQPGGLR
jgi:arylsulfatase